MLEDDAERGKVAMREDDATRRGRGVEAGVEAGMLMLVLELLAWWREYAQLPVFKQCF